MPVQQPPASAGPWTASEQAGAPTGPVQILAVCTGNVCRSPVLECLLGHHLRDAAGPLLVSSAGLRATPGQGMDRAAVRFLHERGVSAPPSFTTRRLVPEQVAQAHLVLTAERAQRATVAALSPGSWDRVFTLREFARLVGDTRVTGPSGADRLLALVAHAAARRRTGTAGADDDVEDPVGRRYAVFRRSGNRIVEPVEAIARLVVTA